MGIRNTSSWSRATGECVCSSRREGKGDIKKKNKTNQKKEGAEKKKQPKEPKKRSTETWPGGHYTIALNWNRRSIIACNERLRIKTDQRQNKHTQRTRSDNDLQGVHHKDCPHDGLWWNSKLGGSGKKKKISFFLNSESLYGTVVLEMSEYFKTKLAKCCWDECLQLWLPCFSFRVIISSFLSEDKF